MPSDILLHQRQVLLTIAYSSIFSQVLTDEEIYKRLLITSRQPVSYQMVLDTLDSLKKKKLLKKRAEYWLLAKLSDELLQIRRKRERLSRLKLQELKPLLVVATKIPWVLAVAVTGSVSVANAEAKDDVDLMVITQRNRLWLVRPLLVLYSFLKGKRRSWNHEEFNSWCLNLWLEENALTVPPSNRSSYTAYEVCQAVWLFDRRSIEYSFLDANSWVPAFLPIYYSTRLQQVSSVDHTTFVWQNNPVLSYLNHLAYSTQRWYMKRHMTREKVSYSYAFFHPRDTKSDIFSSWKKILLNLY